MDREIEAIKFLLQEDCLAHNCPKGKFCDQCEAEKLYAAGYRKQETCENLSDNFDEFICSKCGYQNDDMNESKADDDGEVNHYDYQFKYCPNCGRKVED